MFAKIIYSLFGGLNLAISALILGGIVAYFTSPVLFGFVLLTGSTIAAVKLCGAIAFGVGALLRFATAKDVRFINFKKGI